MSIFGFYFVTQLLREMGWPRKQSIFKGESYDTFVADAVIAQSVDWGAALGAGHPRLSLQMIAEMFRDRWDTDDPPNVKMFIEKSAAQDTWSSAASPRDAVQPPQLTAHFGRSIRPEQFQDRRAQAAMEQLVLEALLWGLSNPDRFAAWYDAALEDQGSRVPRMRGVGLDVEPSLPMEEWLALSEIVHDYEREVGPLPSIPPRLLDDATALGWKISD
jgi:hypothetical protein